MRVPDSLWSLADSGVIEEVLRPLLSGKEAEVFLVRAGGQERVAKVYKEAHQRSFKHRTDYTEGRGGRNSRDRRAIAKRSRHGRAQDEAAWRSAEVDAIYKLRTAGVRVPEPYNFMDGVLVMELVKDAAGNPAPRLGELVFEPDEATAIFDHLLQEVVRMLCAGVVHGDLSDFNVLMSADGPVIIDFPQVVDPASNGSARRLLLRDVDNLQNFLDRFAPGRRRPYAQEMWGLYENSELTAETRLRGDFKGSRRKADTSDVLALIGAANRDEERRRAQAGETVQRGRRGRSRAPATQQTTADTQRTPAQTATEPAIAGPRGRWVEQKMEPPANDRGRSGRGPKAAKADAGNASGRNAGGRNASGRNASGRNASGRQGPSAGRGSGQPPAAEPGAPAKATSPAPTPTNDSAPRKRRRRRRKPRSEGSSSDQGDRRSTAGTPS